MEERKDRQLLLRGCKVGVVNLQVCVRKHGCDHDHTCDHERHDPKRAVFPDLPANQSWHDVHGAAPCIFASNRSAMLGVRISPNSASSALERPSKNSTTRPNTSRS